MIFTCVRTAALLAACIVCLTSPARAGGQTPASFLIYPEFDTRAGQTTFMTLTNVNDGSQGGGPIDVHVVYVDAATCLQSDLFFHLSARDTVTFIANAHVPAGRRGYVWAVALDPVTHRAIRSDYLIGDLFRLDGFASMAWSVQTLGFLGKTAPGANTDVNNGRPDLDGIEYERAPNRFYVPRFFGQTPEPAPRGDSVSDLILMQPLVSPGVTTTTALLIWNDNEEVFSGQYSFTCWTRVRLLSISGVFSQAFLAQSNQSANEVIGAPTMESGWFQVRGATAVGPSGQVTQNPPVFGVMVDVRPNTAAELPYIEAN